MKKIFVFVLLLSLVLASTILAAGDLTTETTSLVVPGNPGETISGKFNIKNTGTTIITTINYNTLALTGPGGTIPENLVRGAVSDLLAGQSRNVTFSLLVPNKQAGDYLGTFRAEDDSNPANYVTIPFTLRINPISIDILSYSETNPLKITTKEDSTETKTFTIKNTGSSTITALTFNYTTNDLDDRDGNVITLTFPTTPVTPINPSEEKPVNLIITIPNNQIQGTYTTIVTASGTTAEGIAVSDTFKLEIRVQPEEVLCSDGVRGYLSITKIDFDEDDFVPGGTLSVDVKVENNYDEDLDVVVEVFLYNVKEEDIIDDVETDYININEGDKETFKDIELNIPTENIDKDDGFILYVKAYEDGNEDDHCAQDSKTIDMKLKSHDILIERFTFSPTLASCGDEVSATIDILNIGTKDQDDVYVELRNSELDLNKKSSTFNIDKFGDKDDDAIVRFSFQIPDNAKDKDYSIEAIVYFRDGKESKSYTGVLTVSGCGAPALADKATLSLIQSSFTVKQGDALSIPVTITNNGDSIASFSVEARASNGWTDRDTKTISIDAGNTRTVYLDLKAPEQEGSYTVTIDLKSGDNTLSTKTVTVKVEKKVTSQVTGGTVFKSGGIFENVPESFWIIANIVLVIIAIFFVKMIFTRRRQ